MSVETDLKKVNYGGEKFIKNAEIMQNVFTSFFSKKKG